MCRKLTCLTFIALVMGLAAGASGELMVQWNLDEGSGTIASDTSGNGRDGTFNGEPQWVAGHSSAGALHFDGVDDFVVHDLGQTDTYATFSVAFWVKADTLGQPVFASPFTGHFPNSAGFQVDVDGGNPGNYRINPNSGNQFAFGPVTLDWVHLALTGEGTSMNLYYNGELAGSNTLVDTDVVFNQFAIGVNRNRNWWFACTIDDLRVYDHVLSEAEILGDMESKPFPFALGPNPADGALHEATWASLSWSPGALAVSHDVYAGESFEDVDSGAESAFQGNQSTTSLVVGFPGFAFPGGLVPGTTYYWRIDEINDVDPNSPWKGDVWSFSVPPRTAYAPVPADGAESVTVDAELNWTGGFEAKLHTVYFGDNFEDVNSATGGTPTGDRTFTPLGPLELAKTYYWRVDEFNPPNTYKGAVWSFRTEGTAADPIPVKGAVDISPTPILKWTTGSLAASHEVYFGADADAVLNAGKASSEYKGTAELGQETYDAGRLELETTYYWRIDEVNSTQAGSPWIGNVWSFTTGGFLVVDDFEAYNDIDPPDDASNRIFDKWIDGFLNPTTNGALIGNDLPPYAEQGIVHGGIQSMIYSYNNAGKTSEATLTLVWPKDWTEEGVTKLSLWFRGLSGNAADRIFVALNGTSVVYHDDAAATQWTGWKEWVIDLQAFAGVNLANVNSITIGIGTQGNPAAGGTGTMYFDDIRLVR